MSDHTTPLRQCTKCGELKPETSEYFYPDKRYKGGLHRQCRACRKDHMKGYLKVYQRKPEYKTRAKTYRQTPEYKAKRRAYEQTPEYKAMRRAYEQSPERRKREKARLQSPERKAYMKVYNQSPEHKAYMKVVWHIRRTRKRALPASFTLQDWRRAMDYFDYRCAVCGRPRGLWHTLAQDHWIPVTKGGPYTPDNIVPLCQGDGGCNNSKNNRDAHEWLIETFGPRKAARIEKRIAAYFAWVKSQEKP